MIRARGILVVVLAVGLIGCGSGSEGSSGGPGASPGGSPSPTLSGTWPGRYFAPYVDGGLWPTLGAISSSVLDSVGARYFTLAFVVSGGSPLQPAWAGVYHVGSTDAVTGDGAFVSGIAGVRSHGGDVIASFGGANGTELAVAYSQAGKTAWELQTAYQSVIDRYTLTAIDFDIEGAAVADTASIHLRNQALKGLEDAAAASGRTLHVSLTLPVLPTGLDANGYAVVQSAISAGVSIHCVNIMCMDYGPSITDMGAEAVSAGNSLFTQLSGLYPSLSAAAIYKMIGLTPMIGVNDITTEVFTLSNASTMLSWAQLHDIRVISMWSFNRDHPGPSSVTSSGVSQPDYGFTNIFVPFTK